MEVPPSWYAALVSNHLNWMATSHRKPMHLWAKPVWNQSIDKHFMIILQWTDNVMPTGCNNPWFLWIKTLESAQVNPLIIIVAVFVDHVTSCYIPSNPMVKTPYINPWISPAMSIFRSHGWSRSFSSALQKSATAELRIRPCLWSCLKGRILGYKYMETPRFR